MKVLLVDDDTLIRDGLKIILETEDDFQVVATASNGQEALELCKEHLPDVVVMDIRMPIMDGVLGTKLIKEQFKNVKVVMLTTFKDDEYIREAIKNGAEGYILKNQSAESIIESLRMIYKGNMVLEKDVAKSISNILKEERVRPKLNHDLSERELEILSFIGEGMSNKEISSKLYLTEGTVRNYVTKLLEKLGLRDRTQLAIYYLKNIAEN